MKALIFTTFFHCSELEFPIAIPMRTIARNCAQVKSTCVGNPILNIACLCPKITREELALKKVNFSRVNE